MKTAYAVSRATGALEVVGTVETNEHNAMRVTFDRKQLARLGPELRPFLLLGSDFPYWPEMPADLLSHKPTAGLWACPRGQLPENRPQTWEGWPLRPGTPMQVAEYDHGQPKPYVFGVLLRPRVSIEQMLACDDDHDGHVIGFLSGPAPVLPKPEEDDEASPAELAAAHAPVKGPRAPTLVACSCGKDYLRETVEKERGKCMRCLVREDDERKKGAADVESVVVEGGDSPSAEGGAAPREALVERGAHEGRGADSGGIPVADGRRKRPRRKRGDGGDAPRDVPGGEPAAGADAPDDGSAGGHGAVADHGAAGHAEVSGDVAPGPGSGTPAASPGPGDSGVGPSPEVKAARTRKQRVAEQQLGIFTSEPAPRGPPCQLCGRTVLDSPSGPQCAFGHAGGVSRVPAGIVTAYGKSPEKLRIRMLTNGGVRFAKPGDEFDAERCPNRPLTDVWILSNSDKDGMTSGVSYRMNEGDWEPVAPPAPKRRARSLDDF